ncbi:MAG: Alkanesulfonate transporter [uncultured bacterium]|nr:MAG: Alkanesulfonate transporter [uncultured bacterium]
MGFGVKPLTTDVIQKQQQVADAFYAQQLIPQKLNIDAAIIK